MAAQQPWGRLNTLAQAFYRFTQPAERVPRASACHTHRRTTRGYVPNASHASARHTRLCTVRASTPGAPAHRTCQYTRRTTRAARIGAPRALRATTRATRTPRTARVYALYVSQSISPSSLETITFVAASPSVFIMMQAIPTG